MKLLLATDLHYLAPELYAGSRLFLEAMRRDDGKLAQCGETLLAALAAEVREEKPDALVIPGDLSMNGERASHARLSEYLKKIRESGTPVWLIPGNHDIRNTGARSFAGGVCRPAPGVTPEEFLKFYHGFMGPQEDEGAGMSYHIEMGRIWLAMIDVCEYKERAAVPGSFTEAHARWLEGVLKKAKAAGAEAITVSHHSAVPQTRFAKELFAMRGHERLAGILKTNGVRLNLSGHLHTQHIAHDGTLTDASTGSMSVCPHLIARITLDGNGTLRYEARPMRDEYLPQGFLKASEAWFKAVSREKNLAALNALPGLDIADEQKQAMADFSARFNCAYYQGAYHSDDPTWAADPAYALWKKWPAGVFGAYFSIVTEEINREHLRWESKA